MLSIFVVPNIHLRIFLSKLAKLFAMVIFYGVWTLLYAYREDQFCDSFSLDAIWKTAKLRQMYVLYRKESERIASTQQTKDQR